jgi:hypothetical protein
MNPWLQFVSEFLPTAMAFIRQHLAEKGTMPTDEEVLAHLQGDADASVAVDDAWLAAHPNVS